MKIDIDVLRNVKGIGGKTLDRVIEAQHQYNVDMGVEPDNSFISRGEFK